MKPLPLVSFNSEMYLRNLIKVQGTDKYLTYLTYHNLFNNPLYTWYFNRRHMFQSDNIFCQKKMPKIILKKYCAVKWKRSSAAYRNLSWMGQNIIFGLRNRENVQYCSESSTYLLMEESKWRHLLPQSSLSREYISWTIQVLEIGPNAIFFFK